MTLRESRPDHLDQAGSTEATRPQRISELSYPGVAT